MGTGIICALSAAVQAALVVAKALGLITWSWFWVLTPIWVGVIILILAVILLIILYSREDGG